MFRCLCLAGIRFQPRRWWCVAVAAVCLGLPGCANLDLRGDPFPEDRSFDLGPRARPYARQTEFWGFTNKARQIEQNFGIHE